MQPGEKGKFCLSFLKNVVDFSIMRDEEVIKFFKDHKGSTCGRFTPEQLERDFLMPPKNIPWLKYLFRFTIPAFLFSLKAGSQTTLKVKPPIEKTPLIKGEAEPRIMGDTVVSKTTTVKGVVKDETGNPVAGATIMVKGTGTGVAADNSGIFLLKDVQTPAILAFSSVGFISQELHLAPGQKEMDVMMNVQMLQGTLGMVSVVKVKSTRKRVKVEKKVCSPEEASFTVYPNPVKINSSFNIKWQGMKEGNYLVEIYNISGALMQSQRFELEGWMKSYIIEQNLGTGNYFIKITEKSGKHFSRQLRIE
jgi:hypothetical protein